MSEVLISSPDLTKLEDAQKQLKQVMTGALPGFVSPTPNKEQVNKKDGTYTQKVDKSTQYARAVYEMASRRDLPYCVAGRKFMRVQAVAGKITAIFWRAAAINKAKVAEELNK